MSKQANPQRSGGTNRKATIEIVAFLRQFGERATFRRNPYCPHVAAKVVHRSRKCCAGIAFAVLRVDAMLNFRTYQT
ncbi:hypothetical protein [Pseudoxanthomonas indica]|uniref:hypothetical protein n=1 Tax=Pseudoxanthomonas indica TaxID=428993 RepID=UPI001590BCEC|nr:hypothetical protein [Pseudoxanthomonas indica]